MISSASPFFVGLRPELADYAVRTIPTQLYSISDIQRVSYCRGYLSGTAQASDTSVTISYLQDLFDLKSNAFSFKSSDFLIFNFAIVVSQVVCLQHENK